MSWLMQLKSKLTVLEVRNLEEVPPFGGSGEDLNLALSNSQRLPTSFSSSPNLTPLYLPPFLISFSILKRHLRFYGVQPSGIFLSPNLYFDYICAIHFVKVLRIETWAFLQPIILFTTGSLLLYISCIFWSLPFISDCSWLIATAL